MKPILVLLRPVLSGVCPALPLSFRLPASDINVFAARSPSDVPKEIAKIHQQETGDKPVFNYGASSLL